MQKLRLLRELCRKAELSQELCKRSRVILKNYILFAFLYCIDGGAIPLYTTLLRHYTL